MNSTSKRILIVDDEEDLTWSISRSLRKENDCYDTICVNSGNEAIEFLKKFSFDLIISDIQMPGINGLMLLEYAYKIQPEIKVIIMSTWDEHDIEKMICTRSGIFYLEKPFDINRMKWTIHRAFYSSHSKYRGRLIDMNLKNIIKHNCQNKFNGYLNITNGKQSGIIYFRSGEVIHAKVGELEGEKALLDVMDWSEGQYDTVLTDTPMKKTIHNGWKLLLEKFIPQV